MPAAAVVGAATAFGLASLLPLNVPVNKPLMYCNSTDIAQTQIKFEGNIYFCANNSIAISCPRSVTFDNTTFDECLSQNKTLQCDLKDDVENVYCTNGTLLNRVATMCNSTTMLNGTNTNETTPILNCYPGSLPDQQAAFIPTEAPITTTTEKQLSIGAKMHIFFLKLIGKGDVLEKKETTESPFEANPRLSSEAKWIPEALTIPPETTTQAETTEYISTTPTTTTTEAPFMYAYKIPLDLGNGTWGTQYHELDKYYVDTLKRFGAGMPDYVEKIPITTTEKSKDTETANTNELIKDINTKTQGSENTTEHTWTARKTLKELEDILSKVNGTIKEESAEDY